MRLYTDPKNNNTTLYYKRLYNKWLKSNNIIILYENKSTGKRTISEIIVPT